MSTHRHFPEVVIKEHEEGYEDDMKQATETFMTVLFQTMFAGQRRWARYTKKISRETRPNNANRRQLLCFNYKRPGFSTRKCKIPKDYDKIWQSLSTWRKERGLSTNKIKTADYIKNTKAKGELLDVMIAATCERDESSLKQNPSETREDIIQNDEIDTDDKNSENIGDIFHTCKICDILSFKINKISSKNSIKMETKLTNESQVNTVQNTTNNSTIFHDKNGKGGLIGNNKKGYCICLQL